MINALFVCARNRRRSPTAQHVFAAWPGIATDSAGLARDAEHVLEPEQLAWADIVFVMEARHRRQLIDGYGAHVKDKRVVVLGIPDDYEAMAPALIERLMGAVGPYLR